MRPTRLPVVDWTDAPADLNGIFRFAERRNLVSARVPSHFNWPPLPIGIPWVMDCLQIKFKNSCPLQEETYVSNAKRFVSRVWYLLFIAAQRLQSIGKDDLISVGWYCQATNEGLVGKTAPLSICPPQIQSNLDRFRTKTSKLKTGN